MKQRKLSKKEFDGAVKLAKEVVDHVGSRPDSEPIVILSRALSQAIENNG